MTNTKITATAEFTDRLFVINNTCIDITDFWGAIVDAVRSGGVLPDELADTFTLTAVDVNGAIRWRLDLVSGGEL